MSAFVFLGPSLPAGESRRISAARILPPVQFGDIYKLVNTEHPVIIGIIDGTFQHVPAVWHKEILWAMTQGVHVLGAASMGALRAAELAPFGMVGIGKIFAAYRDGSYPGYENELFEDDDEVALIHGPEETGYVALSEPLVNMRSSFLAAEKASIISPSLRKRLVAQAKSIFYQDRTYERVLAAAGGNGWESKSIDALGRWLPLGRVDQKRADARSLLEAINGLIDRNPGPKRVDYQISLTSLWCKAFGVEHGGFSRESSSLTKSERSVLDELRLDPKAHARRLRQGLGRLLALQQKAERTSGVSQDLAARAMHSFRVEAGLFSNASVSEWLSRNDLDHAELERILCDEAVLVSLERRNQSALNRYILDCMRLDGEYAKLAARAQDKEKGVGMNWTTWMHDRELSALKAVVWYFEDLLARDTPKDLDGYAREHGFVDLDAFYRAVSGEYHYVMSGESAQVRFASAPGDAGAEQRPESASGSLDRSTGRNKQ